MCFCSWVMDWYMNLLMVPIASLISMDRHEVSFLSLWMQYEKQINCLYQMADSVVVCWIKTQVFLNLYFSPSSFRILSWWTFPCACIVFVPSLCAAPTTIVLTRYNFIVIWLFLDQLKSFWLLKTSTEINCVRLILGITLIILIYLFVIL